jgi:hypothetical protein
MIQRLSQQDLRKLVPGGRELVLDLTLRGELVDLQLVQSAGEQHQAGNGVPMEGFGHKKESPETGKIEGNYNPAKNLRAHL